MPGKTLSRFCFFEHFGYFVRIQADDLFFVLFGRFHLGGVVNVDHIAIEKIFEHRSHGGKFTGFCTVIAAQFLAFEGKTGPYLQYTVVRINSILNKIDGVKGGEINIDNDEMREIIKAIIKLNSSYSICYREKSLSSLCSASFDLASAFSTFYNNISVANEKDEIRKAGYISLLNLVNNKLMQALNVLAIEVPKKM